MPGRQLQVIVYDDEWAELLQGPNLLVDVSLLILGLKKSAI